MNRTRRAGFTLVEMLLVVFILAAVAATAVSALDTADGQLRYDDSKARLAAIRAAIVGDESPAGRATPRGFVADVGRLPTTLNELVEDTGLPAFNNATGMGWRGPYVILPPARSGEPVRYPDGFGNDPSATNYGWQVDTSAGFQVTSAGAGETAGPSLTVETDDALIDVDGLIVRVVFDDADIAAHAAYSDLVIRLHYPSDGAEAVLSLRTTGAVYGGTAPSPLVPATVDPLPALASYSAVEFSLPAHVVPWGVRRVSVMQTSDGVTFSPFGTGTTGRLLLLPRASLPRFDIAWSVN